MIEEGALIRMYDGVINHQELTTKQLNSYGFSSYDLTILIKKKIIERVKQGHYVFLAIDNLFQYGKTLFRRNKKEQAILCFKKCHELEPDCREVVSYLFLGLIQNGDYNSAFEYFDLVFDEEKDSNYCLYLLNMITNLPDEYKVRAKTIKLEDTLHRNDNKQNMIRVLSFARGFTKAYIRLIEMFHQQDIIRISDIIVKTLLIQARDEQVRIKKNIVQLIREKRYCEVVSILEQMEERCGLTKYDEVVLFLTQNLISMSHDHIVPEVELDETKSLFEAIYGHNYYLAYQLDQDYLKKHQINPEVDMLYSLLNDVLKCIDEINHRNLCSKKDFDSSFLMLDSYLDSLHCSEYKFLVTDLIRLSLLQNDMSLERPMDVLSCIVKGKFEFDLNQYMEEFYRSLSQKQFAQSRIYLDIIAKSKSINPSIDSIVNLEQLLNSLEEKEKIELDTSVIVPIKSSYLKENDAQNQEGVDTQEYQLLKENMKQLRERGIILLGSMGVEERKRIYQASEQFPNIVSFGIGETSERQVVLRYKSEFEPDRNMDFLIKEGNKDYYSANYEEAIIKFRQLLEFGTPPAWLYAKLGLSYFRTNASKDMVIDYFTVATELSKKLSQTHKKYDFTELIFSLKESISKDNKKPYFQMSLDDFSCNRINEYETNKISSISLLMKNGLSFEDACKRLEIEGEDKSIMALSLARKSYSLDFCSLGDQYIKLVEHTKGKTEKVKVMMAEIIRNKKFYKK